MGDSNLHPPDAERAETLTNRTYSDPEAVESPLNLRRDRRRSAT
jgi:hypothetical protein